LRVVDKRHREILIATHFINFLNRNAFQNRMHFQLLLRDQPWDFCLFCSSGCVINIEIVTISDNKYHLEVNSREEARDLLSHSEYVPLRNLEKVARLFPDDRLQGIIEGYRAENVRPSELVKNPDYPPETKIYLSGSAPPQGSLSERLSEALRSKMDKDHFGKERTFLVVDNRTSAAYTDELEDAGAEIAGLIDACEFPEIWAYTGYCSDWNGLNAQCTFVGLKVSDLSWMMPAPPRGDDRAPVLHR
jgi:hypothetical protein